MCADKADFFHCSAYKLMISDLKDAVPRTDINISGSEIGGGESDLEWDLKITHIPDDNDDMVPLRSFMRSKPVVELYLKLIWIQGKVKRFHRMSSDSEHLSLVITDDVEERDTAIIHEYAAVPGGDCDDIKLGSYVAALGQIWLNDTKEGPVIKAAKIMHLGDKPMLKVWKDEVRLAKAFFAGLYRPEPPSTFEK